MLIIIILVHNNSWEDHIKHAELVLQRLSENGLTAASEVYMRSGENYVPNLCGRRRCGASARGQSSFYQEVQELGHKT